MPEAKMLFTTVHGHIENNREQSGKNQPYQTVTRLKFRKPATTPEHQTT